MANDCLHTKLKGSVSDMNLPVLGALNFKISTADGNITILGSNISIEKYDSNGDLVSTVSAMDTLAPGINGTLVVKNKYGLTQLRIIAASTMKLTAEDVASLVNLTRLETALFDGDLSALTNLTSLSRLVIGVNSTKTKGNISALGALPLTYISLGAKQEVYGDVAVFADNDSFTYVGVDVPGIYGDIASFGKSTALESLYCTNSECSGSIEGLADEQVANGRTSGTLVVYGANGIITYNGAIMMSYKTITFSGGSYTIS